MNRPNPADRIDATKPLPFANGSIDEILAEHFCEHLSAPNCLHFFDECHRVLKAGRVLRVCVPVLDRIKDKAHARDLVVSHGHEVVMTLQVLIQLLILSGFDTVTETGRKECDGHWKVIGEEKDYLETLRVEARKA